MMMDSRPGYALVLAMLLVLALMVMGMGVLAVGEREAQIAGAVLRKAKADRLAESAAMEAFRTWSTRSVEDLHPGMERAVASSASGGSATVTRIDTGLFLIRGEGRVAGPHGATVGSAGLLVRTLSGLEGVAPAAVTAADSVILQGGAVYGTGGCDSAGIGVMTPSLTRGPGTTLTGLPGVVQAAPPPFPSPDPFAPPLVEQIADLRVATAAVSPSPSQPGVECPTDPAGWGSTQIGHPCHDRLPLAHAPADLTVSGGAGRLVLVVDGNLTVTNGAALEGLVVVRGELRLEEGSSIRGAVRARSVVITDGAVTGDRCAVVAAATAPALDRAFRPPLRWWIPAF